jgi:hypothetical protein
MRMAVPLAALALGTACSGLGDNFREPQVQLDRVVVRGVGFSGGTLDLVVRLQEPEQLRSPRR